ncbi:MAG: site-specific integrase [Candidatus Neptunochlamydia sp.]|nr:site-specific integrase [Candidatus Neptunochlamydia sp.]
MSDLGHLRKRESKSGKPRYQMIVEVWKKGKKYYKSKTFDSEKLAKKWGNKVRYEIENRITNQESLKRRTFKKAAEKYIKEVLPHKPRNARNVEQHLKWWIKEFNLLEIKDITPSFIAECRDKLLKEPTHQKKQRAPATVVRYLSSLSALFETALKEWHWLDKNPVRMIRKPSVSNSRTRFLSEEECQKLLTSCKESKNPYLYSVVVIALSTGMRRGEILGLKWKDIDFEKKLITLEQTKNGTTRYVPLVSLAAQVLKSLFEKETILDSSYHVFPSLNPNRYLDIRTAWQFALKRAEITDFTFHSLRHSCASFLAQTNTNQRDIAEILGHRDLRMTFRYSHLTTSHLGEKLEKANERFIGKKI